MHRPLEELVRDLGEELHVPVRFASPLPLGIIDDLASESGMGIASVLGMLHDKAAARVSPVPTNLEFFRSVPVPTGLTIENLKASLDYTQDVMAMLNYEVLEKVGEPLCKIIQGNNFSGLVSNVLSSALEHQTPYVRNSDQQHPDNINRGVEPRIGLEVKVSSNAFKGGEGHNGTDGWHLVACYALDRDSGLIRFSQVELGELQGYGEAPDVHWKYLGSKEKENGNRRTETYVTTALGTSILRHGSVYLDVTLLPNWARAARLPKGEAVPAHSPWHGLTKSTKASPKRATRPDALEKLALDLVKLSSD